MRFPVGAVAAALTYLWASPAIAETLNRADGSTIHYRVDVAAAPARGVILIAQGSGCLPTGKNPSLASVRAAFSDYTAVIVEKSGVTPDASISDGFTDCPTAFHQTSTLTQRIADYRAVLAHLRQDTGLAALPLVLFGGSEGGLAVARLAVTESPQATIIMSSASGTTLRETIMMTVPPEGQATVAAGFDAAMADPAGSALFAGSSHRFWADSLDARSLDTMLQAEGPFLVIQGGRDASSPPQASRATLDAFAAAGKCTLTYWEFPALDHGMNLPDGTSRLAGIAALAAQWVAAPTQGC